MGDGFPNLFLYFEYQDAQDIRADVLSGVDDGDLAPPDDVEAVKYFLSTVDGPKAFRSHRAQAERFLHFLTRVKSKTLADLVPSDLDDYFAFATDPQPKEEWVSNVPHVARRASKHWRPFRLVLGHFARSALAYSIRRMVLWLQKIEYVQVFDVGQGTKEPYGNFLQYLTVEQWDLLKLYVETLRTGDNTKDEYYHRVRWMLHLVYLGGLTSQEIALTPMRNFTEAASVDGMECWQLVAVTANAWGKNGGPRVRLVSVGPDFLRELRVYRKSLGLTPLPTSQEDWNLLVPRRVKSTGLRFRRPHVRDIVVTMKAIFSGFSLYLLSVHPSKLDQAQAIEKGNVTWLRRTAAKHLLDIGVDFPAVCKFLGVTESSKILRPLRLSARLHLEQLALRHRSAWPDSQD